MKRSPKVTFMTPSITQPFGFRQYLQPLKRPDYAFPFILAGLIALGLYLRSGDFLLAPGLAVDLPRLSQSQAMSLPVHKVLTVIDPQMLLFEGKIYSLKELEILWAKGPILEGRLLLKCDQAAPLGTVLQICELAKAAGFEGVQIAANTMDLPHADFVEV